MIKRIFRLYFNSWWLPAVPFLVLLGGATLTAVPRLGFPPSLANSLFYLAALALLGIVAVAIRNLIKKRWAKGVVNVLLVLGCGAATLLCLFFVASATSEDGLAHFLGILAAGEIAEPRDEFADGPGTAPDAFQSALLEALQTPGTADTTISGSIPNLVRLHDSHGSILRRYLATSPAWRVFEDDGNLFATRRWMIGSGWRCDLRGYYTQHDIDRSVDAGTPTFQSRLTIGLSGKPWQHDSKGTTWLQAGQTAKVALSPHQVPKSHCVISADSLVVELFEQSAAPERRLTKAALAFLQTELQPLAESSNWETARQMLPPGTIRKGKPSFDIRSSSQPGIYRTEIWLNPGESGMLYLKALDMAQGIAPPVDRLQDRANERIGWSDDTEELFFSNTPFTIHEGKSGKTYAARLEVWFHPDADGPDKKLMEKAFRVEGWHRRTSADASSNATAP